MEHEVSEASETMGGLRRARWGEYFNLPGRCCVAVKKATRSSSHQREVCSYLWVLHAATM